MTVTVRPARENLQSSQPYGDLSKDSGTDHIIGHNRARGDDRTLKRAGARHHQVTIALGSFVASLFKLRDAAMGTMH
jgi:hypothetical protein